MFPNRFLFITRRCTQRCFLLRPDDATNNAFTYMLGEAAHRYGIKIVLSQMMSNHHHTLLFDAEGRQVEFREHFHKLLARSQNALRGRWENLWATEEPCTVEVLDREDVLEKLVYIATNPVKDGLVDKVHHWPGPKFVNALLENKRLRAHRPKHFRKNGKMPAEIEPELGLPADFENSEELLGALRRRIEEVEAACAAERAKSGRRVIGRRSILRQHAADNPSTHEPRRTLRPRVASRSKWLRIAALQRNKDWEAAYRVARTRWLQGEDVVFPHGTYWLRRFADVRVEPPPPQSER